MPELIDADRRKMATVPSIQIIPDRWLAALLERDAYRVALPAGCPVEVIQSQLRSLQPGFYYAKLPTVEVQQSAELQRHGFTVVDVNVTLERVGSVDFQTDETDCHIARFEIRRHMDVPRIAEKCFVYSRFHLDSRIPKSTADRIKRAWVENYIAGKRGDCLWVAQWRDVTAGFLCELYTNHNGVSTSVIDLVGVNPSYQGRGIGRALVQHVLKMAGERNVRVGTQVANIPSVRLYEQCGFRFVESSYVLHGHVGL